MKKSFRAKNILMIIVLSLVIFIGGKIYFSNPNNIAKLDVSNNTQGIISIQEVNN
ncbi:TPA: hypothetical protein ACOTG0_002266 [Clostridium perfringens]